MAAEMSRGKLAVTARLRSPVMRQAASTCEIHAWYHLWRAGMWLCTSLYYVCRESWGMPLNALLWAEGPLPQHRA